jgi:O-antigen ligase
LFEIELMDRIRRIVDLLFTRHGLAWFMAVMLVFWAPLPGEQRLPILFLIPIGIWLHSARRAQHTPLPGLSLLRACFLLLIVPVLTSLPGSANPDSTTRIAIVLAVSYFVAVALIAGLSSRPPLWFSRALGLIFGLWIIDGLIQWHFGVDILGVPLLDNRIVEPFGDNLRMSVLMGVMMPIALFPLSARQPVIALLFYVGITCVIGLSGARASLVFALLTGVGLFFQLPSWRHRIALIVGCLGVVGYAAWFSPALKQRLVESNYSEIMRNPGDNNQATSAYMPGLDEYLSGRVTIWHTAWQMFHAHPVVGIGAGAFDEAYPHYITRPDDPFRGGSSGRHVFHAHQLYISAAAETGIIGLTGLLASIVLVVRWYRRLPVEARARAYPYAYSLGVALFPLNSQHNLFIGWWYFTLLLSFCAMLATSRETRPGTF